jgi:hypothetical protein
MAKRQKLFMAALSLALFANGCAPAGFDADWVASSSVAQDWQAEPADWQITGPLDFYLDLVWGADVSRQEMQLRSDQAHNAREEYIARCMHQAGFDYIPVPVMRSDSSPALPLMFPWDRDWVAQFGYGAALLRTWSRTIWDDYFAHGAPAFVDPNLAITESLSPSEREAYFLQMWGPPRTLEEIEAEILSGEAQGCQNQADQFMPQPDEVSDAARPQVTHAQLWNNPEFRRVLEFRGTNMQSAFSNPQAISDWANCMANTGYPGLTSVWRLPESFIQELNMLPQHLSLTSREFIAFREREIATALADFDCRVATDFTERAREMQLSDEIQFVNDNQSTLDSLRSLLEQGN